MTNRRQVEEHRSGFQSQNIGRSTSSIQGRAQASKITGATGGATGAYQYEYRGEGYGGNISGQRMDYRRDVSAGGGSRSR